MASEKPPAFSFYPQDFMSGTITMTLEQRGAYITLLCYQWDKGSIPADEAARTRILGSSRRIAESVWTAMLAKFEQGADGCWRNARLERERQKQADRRAALAANGQRGGRPPTKPKGFLNQNQTETKRFSESKPNGNQKQSLSSSSSFSCTATDLVLKNELDQQQPPRLRKRPQFENQHFAVHRWQVEELMSMLGVHVEPFDLDEWLMTGAAARAKEETSVVPDWWKWLKAETLREAQRRGLPIASSNQPDMGKQTTRLASALANIKSEKNR